MKNNLLSAYASWITRYPKRIVIGAFLVSIVSILLSVFFLKTQTGILDLYSKDDPVAKQFIRYVDRFGAAETLIIVFEGKNEDERRAAVHALADKLSIKDNATIKNIFYKVDLDLFKRHAFQFLKEDEAQALLHEINSPQGGVRLLFEAQSFNDYVKFLNNSIAAGFKNPKMAEGDATKKFEQGLKPILLLAEYLDGKNISAPQIASSLQENQKQQNVDELGYLRTEDKKMHIMLINPVDKRQDYEAAKALVALVRGNIDSIRPQFPGVSFGVTGGPALNNDQFEVSRRDMTRASVFAYISTGIIFILAFKSFGRPVLGLMTLALSLTWSFGLTTATIGHLNMFSMAFLVILVGQGTYYGVHVVSRYEEELLRGRSVPDAVQQTICHVFGNITASTLTTAAAFFATMLVPLKGFAELGWIAGMGIILSSLGMQMVLPAMLMLYDKNGPRGNILSRKRQVSVGRQKIQRTFSNMLLRGAPVFILAVLAVAAWGGYRLWGAGYGIPFDSNVLNLQAKNTEAVVYEKKLIETSLSPRSGIFMTDSFEKAQAIAEALQKLPTIQRVEWLGEAFPTGTVSEKTQGELQKAVLKAQETPLQAPRLDQLRQNLEILKKHLEKISDLALANPAMSDLLETNENAMSAIDSILAKLPDAKKLDAASRQVVGEAFVGPQIVEFQNRFFLPLRALLRSSASASVLRIKDLPPEILDRFLSADKTYAVYAFPKVNIWERKPLESFVRDLRLVSNEVTGPPIMFYEILALVRSSYFQAALYSAMAIFCIFLLDFRSLKYALLAFSPLVIGIFSLLGFMSIADISFNTANLIALPMILGIGADNGVHLIHRFREEKERSIDFLFRSTGKALLITYLDTTTSFLGIALASHQGLAQLGRVVILGITCCTVAGIVFLPSVMSLMIQHRQKKAAAASGPSDFSTDTEVTS